MDNKNNIRRNLNIIRDAISIDDRINESNIITKKIIITKLLNSVNTVMSYINFRSEVETTKLIQHCLEKGIHVTVPKVCGSEIVSAKIDSFESLIPGRFGILEPDITKSTIIEPDKIDLVIVPGLGFDKNKMRIGYGAGYYDKFLTKVRKNCVKVGICFDLQLMESLICEQHDLPMSLVVTGKRIIN